MSVARILHVDHVRAFGGAERSLVSLIAHLDRARFAPLLAVPGPGPLADAVAARGVPILKVPFSGADPALRLVGVLRAGARIAALGRRERIHILHANTLKAGYACLLAGQLTGLPVVWHVRDMTYPAAGRLALCGATRIVANSKATAATLGGARGHAGRLRVVYNGVAADRRARPERVAAFRAGLGLAPGAPLVGMMGRLDPWKGHRDFLGAAARIAARDPAVRFVIAGGTPLGRGDVYRRELRDAVADLGLGDRVFFTGHLDDVAPVLGALRLLVHPSRSPEPFGRSVIEAMSFGVPVVASRAGGVVEIVDEGSNGLLFEPGNVEELAAAVTRLLGDPGTAARMARAARETVVTRFSASGHARRMEDVFLEAIGEARGRRPDAYFARGDQG